MNVTFKSQKRTTSAVELERDNILPFDLVLNNSRETEVTLVFQGLRKTRDDFLAWTPCILRTWVG